jgi:hypothetical protein
MKTYPKLSVEKYLKSTILACGRKLDDKMADILSKISP